MSIVEKFDRAHIVRMTDCEFAFSPVICSMMLLAMSSDEFCASSMIDDENTVNEVMRIQTGRSTDIVCIVRLEGCFACRPISTDHEKLAVKGVVADERLVLTANQLMPKHSILSTHLSMH